MLRGELADLFGKKVSSIRDGIVVEHAGKVRRAKHRVDVRFHLAPIAAINVRRQYHQTLAAGAGSTFCECDGFGSAQRSNCGHDRNAISNSADERRPKRDLLVQI